MHLGQLNPPIHQTTQPVPQLTNRKLIPILNPMPQLLLQRHHIVIVYHRQLLRIILSLLCVLCLLFMLYLFGKQNELHS